MAEQIARAEMLIRRPAPDVFDAFVQPELIKKFWLKDTTGPLGQGAQVEWEFMVPGATERVQVAAFDAPRRIAFTWREGGLDVDMAFSEELPGITTASVEVRGFERDGGTDPVVNATEGFSIVLCDLKVLLETGASPGLVKDKAELVARARGA
ncbi:SRPBCC domain-containing protein [Polaromonas sp. LjRoot131]|uniref:SRPBCC domain-containing protein n=1 Tax=Polaromonas sp. LjRoot131 TaxID=3342262 RepID=UPI003ECD939A